MQGVKYRLISRYAYGKTYSERVRYVIYIYMFVDQKTFLNRTLVLTHLFKHLQLDFSSNL